MFSFAFECVSQLLLNFRYFKVRKDLTYAIFWLIIFCIIRANYLHTFLREDEYIEVFIF